MTTKLNLSSLIPTWISASKYPIPIVIMHNADVLNDCTLKSLISGQRYLVDPVIFMTFDHFLSALHLWKIALLASNQLILLCWLPTLTSFWNDTPHIYALLSFKWAFFVGVYCQIKQPRLKFGGLLKFQFLCVWVKFGVFLSLQWAVGLNRK